MPERITLDDVAHVAHLARLALGADESQRLLDELAAVLDHFADIDALDLDAVEAMTQPYPLHNVLRPDVVTPCLDPAEVLAEAPATEDGRFKVPSILGDAR